MHAVVNGLLCRCNHQAIFPNLLGYNPRLFLLHVLIAFTGQVNHFKHRISEFISFQQLAYFVGRLFHVSKQLMIQFIHQRCVQRRHFAFAQLVHQHKSAINKISKNGYQLTVDSILKSLPSKLAVFCFWGNLSKVIAQGIYHHVTAIFLFNKILDIILHLNTPSSARAHLISFEVHEFIAWHVVRQNISMQFQHRRKYDAMKNNVVLTNKMHQFGIVVIPIRLPVFLMIQRPLLGGTDISYWRVKPHIQYFSSGFIQRHRHTPIKVTRHRTGLQTRFYPAFTLTNHIRTPVIFVGCQYPFTQKLFMQIQWEIPMFCHTLHRCIPTECTSRVYELLRTKRCATLFTLIAISIVTGAMRTSTNNVPVCKKCIG